jgi:signal peptidase I
MNSRVQVINVTLLRAKRQDFMDNERDIADPFETEPGSFPVEEEREFPLPTFTERPLFVDPLFNQEVASPPTSPSFGQRAFGAVKEVLETVVPAVIIALLINLFLAQATRVYGQSMEPNLHTDQRLVVEKVSYRFHAPQRNDVVVLKIKDDAEELLIKRVIALPGETVEIRNGHVFVDGEMLDESYLTQSTRGHYGPTYVPPLHIFVLGDNRSASNDSRSFGPIHIDNVVGRAWLSYWPLEDVGFVE